jgi:AcrR family transcriptional regulator
MQTLKDEVKNNIIAAAIKEFYLYGYEKASMRDIAKSAGISVSNTYNYYRNKEQLFSDIIEPIFQQVKTIFKQSLLQSSSQDLKGDNILAFTREITGMLMQMDARQRQLLIILAEKSAGTRYEKTRQEMVTLLRMHFAELLRQTGNVSQIEEKQGYILTIIAENYIDGLLKILKDYRSPEWAEENLKTLIKYHLNGVSGLTT